MEEKLRHYCLKIGPPMRWKRVTGKHKKGQGCLCHIDWLPSEKGDLIIDLKRQKREWRNDWSRWHRRTRWLAKKRAAPAFQKFLDKARADHAALEPKFTFAPLEPIRAARF